jgi:hypothetical protein
LAEFTNFFYYLWIGLGLFVFSICAIFVLGEALFGCFCIFPYAFLRGTPIMSICWVLLLLLVRKLFGYSLLGFGNFLIT